MEFLTGGPLHSVLATFLLCVVLWISCRVGRVFLTATGCAAMDFTALERGLFSLGIGMLILSFLIFLVGVAGFLTALSVTLLLLILLSISFVCLQAEKQGIGEERARVFEYARKSRLFFTGVLAVFFLAWIQAVSPPTSNDALAYHLYHSKEFVLRHKIEYISFSRESLWPYFTETFFTLGLLLEGTVLAQLFHWVFYILTGLLVYSFGRRFYDELTARLAMIVFIFTPVAFAQAGHAYVDLALAFYVFAGIYAFLLVDICRQDKIFIVAGALSGGAMAVKYLGLGAFLILFIFTAIKTRLRAKPLFYFGLSAFLVSGFWYIHSWAAIGNPVYPFFFHFFGGNGYETKISQDVGMGNGFLPLLRMGWNMTMRPQPFGGEIIGPLFLMFLPALVLGTKKTRQSMATVTAFVVLYALFLFTQSQQVRFYLSVIPILSVGAAVGVRRLMERDLWIKRLVYAVAGVVILLHGAGFVSRIRSSWPVVLGNERAEEYLMKHERSFRGYTFFRNNLKIGEKFFNAAEVRCFYNPASGQMVRDEIPFRLDLKKKNFTMNQFLETRRFHYIWISDDTAEDVRRFVGTHSYQKVFSYDFTESPRTFHYTIYQFIHYYEETGKTGVFSP